MSISLQKAGNSRNWVRPAAWRAAVVVVVALLATASASRETGTEATQAATSIWQPPERRIFTGFGSPDGLTVDAAGDVFVADASEGGEVWKFSPDRLITRIASVGSARDVAVDAQGTIYVIGNEPVVPTLATVRRDGRFQMSDLSFKSGDELEGMAVDDDGNIYIAAEIYRRDRGEILRISPRQHAIESIFATATGRQSINAVALDAKQSLYVAVTESGIGTILKLAHDGRVMRVTSGFAEPTALAIDGSGTIYLASLDGTVKKVSSDGTKKYVAFGLLRDPEGLATKYGNLYIADRGLHRVLKIARDGKMPEIGCVENDSRGYERDC